MDHLHETLESSQIVFAGRTLTVAVETTRLPDGRLARREIAHHPGAVGILVIAGQEVVLIRQYRHAVGETLLEIPAGTLEPGEAPLAAAKRELHEEAGLAARDWHLLGRTIVSPGFCDEVIHLFVATGLQAAPGGTPDADERIEVVRMPVAEALAGVRAGLISDAKSQVALLLGFLPGDADHAAPYNAQR